jgi:hypothetical protein
MLAVRSTDSARLTSAALLLTYTTLLRCAVLAAVA